MKNFWKYARWVLLAMFVMVLLGFGVLGLIRAFAPTPEVETEVLAEEIAQPVTDLTLTNRSSSSSESEDESVVSEAEVAIETETVEAVAGAEEPVNDVSVVADPPVAAVEVEPIDTAVVSSLEDPVYNAVLTGVTLIPVGEPIDLSGLFALPEGFPEDWDTMAPTDQADYVSELVGGPVEPVLGEPGVAFAMNAKDVTSHSYVCAVGLTCHWHLAESNATVFFRGHGESAEIYAGTFRIESLIPGGGGLCYNWHEVLIYEASIQNLVFGLGEVMQCPPLPEARLVEINIELAARLQEVSELSGASVISIGTVADGFGAFWVYADGLGTQDVFCPTGFACFYSLDSETWVWADAGESMTGARGAILFDTALVPDYEALAEELIN